MEKRIKKEKKQKIFFSASVILFLMVCGLSTGYMLGGIRKRYFAGVEVDLGDYLYVLALVLVIISVLYILHIYLHEIGHMVAGLLSGYRFQSIRFGSFMILKTDKGLKLRRFSMAGTGGQCLMLPPETASADYPTILYNMGGCLANLLVAAMSMLGYFYSEENSVPSMLFLVSVLVGVGMALVNGIPLSSLSNDGYNIGILKKDAEARTAFRNQLNINNQLAQGKSVKDMPEEWFAWEEKVTENNLTTSAGVLRFSYLMECQRFEEAKAVGTYLLKNALSIADVHVSYMKAELLFCDMMLGEESENIKMKYEENKKRFDTLKTMLSMQRILFAYYTLVEKKAKKAEECLKQFEQIAKKYPYPTEMEVERELIALVKTK